MNFTTMDNTQHHTTAGGYSILSGLCALISLMEVQPVLIFISTSLAIASGIVSLYKNIKK
jgi:hypothetical protein